MEVEPRWCMLTCSEEYAAHLQVGLCRNAFLHKTRGKSEQEERKAKLVEACLKADSKTMFIFCLHCVRDSAAC
jgi:hypothetical protein